MRITDNPVLDTPPWGNAFLDSPNTALGDAATFGGQAEKYDAEAAHLDLAADRARAKLDCTAASRHQGSRRQLASPALQAAVAMGKYWCRIVPPQPSRRFCTANLSTVRVVASPRLEVSCQTLRPIELLWHIPCVDWMPVGRLRANSQSKTVLCRPSTVSMRANSSLTMRSGTLFVRGRRQPRCSSGKHR